jgi:hypothetical protein
MTWTRCGVIVQGLGGLHHPLRVPNEAACRSWFVLCLQSLRKPSPSPSVSSCQGYCHHLSTFRFRRKSSKSKRRSSFFSLSRSESVTSFVVEIESPLCVSLLRLGDAVGLELMVVARLSRMITGKSACTLIPTLQPLRWMTSNYEPKSTLAVRQCGR